MATEISGEKRVSGLLKRVEGWAQEELGAKQRLLEALREQEAALSTNGAERLETASRRVAEQVQAEPARAAILASMLDALGRAWQVDPLALTLGGISERAGEQGANLARLRAELRAVCEESMRVGRRIALIAGTQRAVLTEALGLLAGGAEPSQASGRLVDAEA
jgi:hypothetical protein